MPADRLDRSKPPVVPIAPPWHTAALVALMVAVALVGTLLARTGRAVVSPGARASVLAAYVPLALVNGALALYVSRIGRARSALGPLLGRGWRDARRAAGDLALAAAGFVLVEAAEAAFGAWRNAAAAALAPHTAAERGVWVLVAASVGFCEELVYRGYLQIQLAAFTGQVRLAIVLQAVLFGLAHGEQGLLVAIRFAVYGAALGALARWRRSLVPGIVCHVAIDLAGGLLAG